MSLIGYHIRSGPDSVREYDKTTGISDWRDTILHCVVCLKDQESKASFENETVATELCEFLNSIPAEHAKMILDAVCKAGVARHEHTSRNPISPHRWDGRHRFGD